MTTLFDKLPEKEGLLDQDVIVNGSDGNIRIIREFESSNASVGLFDFDGTLSDEQIGWPNLMVAVNASFLVALTNPHMDYKKAVNYVIQDIEKTIGIPTYMQMKNLGTLIAGNGYKGGQIDPLLFKNVYNDTLIAMVESRHKHIKNRGGNVQDLLIPGALDLLKAIQVYLKDGIYLASGSDVDAVVESIENLGLSEYFPRERIAGAGSLGPEDDAKEAVIQKLLNEKGYEANQLVTFGDGVPEIYYTYVAGGVSVGVLTRDESHYEGRGHFTVIQKEERLRRAGAHIIVNNPYQNVEKLIEILKKGYRSN